MFYHYNAASDETVQIISNDVQCAKSYFSQLKTSILARECKSFRILTRKGLYTLHVSKTDLIKLNNSNYGIINLIFDRCKDIKEANQVSYRLTVSSKPLYFNGMPYRIVLI